VYELQVYIYVSGVVVNRYPRLINNRNEWKKKRKRKEKPQQQIINKKISHSNMAGVEMKIKITKNELYNFISFE
jgi:hypothetical protein